MDTCEHVDGITSQHKVNGVRKFAQQRAAHVSVHQPEQLRLFSDGYERSFNVFAKASAQARSSPFVPQSCAGDILLRSWSNQQ